MSGVNYLIAHAAISGILVPPTFVFFVLSCFQAGKRKDPVRTGTPLLGVAYFLFFLSLLITVAADGLYIAILYDTANMSTSTFYTFFKTSNYLSMISGYFENLSTITTLAMFLYLGYGFYCLSRPNVVNKNNVASANDGVVNRAQRKIVHVVVSVVSLILFALCTALLGKALATYVTYYNLVYTTGSDGDSDYSDDTSARYTFITGVMTSRKLGGSFAILVWVMSLPLVGFACMLVHRSRGLAHKGATVLYLVAAIFWCLRFLWALIYNALWLLPANSVGAPLWFDIADPFLNAWFYFVVLILLYLVCVRKAGGLWSTSQPWTHYEGAPGQFAPQQYGVYNANNNGQYMSVAQMPGQGINPVPVVPMQYHQNPHQVHEMAHPVQPVYPQEMFAPQHQQHQYQPYQSQTQGYPPQQQQAYPPYQGSPQQSPSPQSSSAHPSNPSQQIQPTPPPPEVKSS